MKTPCKLLALSVSLSLLLAPLAAAVDSDPAAGDGTAYASSQRVLLNGVFKDLHAYALKDENGFLTNFVKIRDMADLLSPTTARFDVEWDGGVKIWTGRSYLSPNGQENQAPYSGDRPFFFTSASTAVNGVDVAVASFTLLDDQGNGSTYYKLRDLARVLNFHVSWEGGDTGVLMDTSIPYREQ